MDSEDYDRWNEKKQKLNIQKREILFKEGEIWWCSLGLNIGQEVYGKGEQFLRPVIILRKLSDTLCIVLPITTKEHAGNWYHHFYLNSEPRWAMLRQIRSVSSSRLTKKQAELSRLNFNKLKKSVAFLLGPF